MQGPSYERSEGAHPFRMGMGGSWINFRLPMICCALNPSPWEVSTSRDSFLMRGIPRLAAVNIEEAATKLYNSRRFSKRLKTVS